MKMKTARQMKTLKAIKTKTMGFSENPVLIQGQEYEIVSENDTEVSIIDEEDELHHFTKDTLNNFFEH